MYFGFRGWFIAQEAPSRLTVLLGQEIAVREFAFEGQDAVTFFGPGETFFEDCLACGFVKCFVCCDYLPITSYCGHKTALYECVDLR